jgi:hypothetical protein
MKWKFKEDAKPQESSSGFWYGINNGYVKPEEVIDDKAQLDRLNMALDIVRSFEQELENNDLLPEM